MMKWLHEHLWTQIAEHIPWIIFGGVLLALTGFTPEEWINRAIDQLPRSIFSTVSIGTLAIAVRIFLGSLGLLFILVALVRWERLRELWWLWSIFGVSGGVIFTLWLIPLVVGTLNSQNDNAKQAAVESQLKEAQREGDYAKQNVSTLQSQLTATTAELADAKRKLADLESNIGPEVTTYFLSNFGLSDIVKTMPETFVIVTATPDNEALRRELESIFNQARGISAGKSMLMPMPLPNYEIDLDAPKLEGLGARGVTIHGRNQAGNLIFLVLSNDGCLITHQTGDTPTALLDYTRQRSPSTHVANITWVEIGKGSPFGKSPGCLNH
jgi:hypothetical protein